MDYDSASDDFLLISLIFNHPFITIPAIILCIIFAVKSCTQEEQCQDKICQTGAPMIVKGECLCVQKAK